MPRFISVLLIMALAMPMLVAQKKQARSDDVIFDEVRQKLADDSEVRGGGLDITVKDGAITIKGYVHTEKAKEKATVIAKKVKGVTTVDNQLKLFSDKEK